MVDLSELNENDEEYKRKQLEEARRLEREIENQKLAKKQN